MPEKDGPKQKSRTITWAHQMIEQNPAESGLEYLLAIKEGRIPPPPVWNLIGCRLAEIREGCGTLEITPAEYHYNRFGVVQGGILCTMLDAYPWPAPSVPLSLRERASVRRSLKRTTSAP